MSEGHRRPTVVRRKLTHELRVLREHAGLSQAAVVKRFDWSLSKLVRMENGSVRVSVPDLMALASLYGAGPDKTDELVALSRGAKDSRWWTSSPYRQVVPPQLQQFLGYEADASQILMFHQSVVPGLLQTVAYTRAVAHLGLNDVDEERIQATVNVRQRRQKEVVLGAEKRNVVALLDEAVLWRCVGGAATMREQLGHLQQLTRDDRLDLGIVPFSQGAYFGMNGAFHIMEFAEPKDDRGVLYIESIQNSHIFQDRVDLVKQYRDRFDEMLKVSVRGSHAVDFIEAVVGDIAASTR